MELLQGLEESSEKRKMSISTTTSSQRKIGSIIEIPKKITKAFFVGLVLPFLGVKCNLQ